MCNYYYTTPIYIFVICTLYRVLHRRINYNDYIFRTLFHDKQTKYNNGLQMHSLFEFTRDFLIDKGYDVKIKGYEHF